MTRVRPELGLERLIAALERDLLDATDREIREAANEIGMDPTLKGSAALFGVLFTVKRPAAHLHSADKSARPRSGKETGAGSSTRSARRPKKGARRSD